MIAPPLRELTVNLVAAPVVVVVPAVPAVIADTLYHELLTTVSTVDNPVRFARPVANVPDTNKVSPTLISAAAQIIPVASIVTVVNAMPVLNGSAEGLL